MTRLLFLTESYHPVLGGGERHIRALSARLAAEGVAATVLTRQTDAAWPEEEMDGAVRVVRVPPSGRGRMGKYAMVPRAVGVLRRERHAYDVVVVRGTRVLGLPGLLMGRVLGKAVVMQAEVNGELSGDVYTWGTPLDRPVLRGAVRRAVGVRNALLADADAFVAMSRRIRDEFLAAGVPEERVVLIPHGIDTGRFRPANPAEQAQTRRRLGLPEDRQLVTYTGRLLKGKGLESLVDAFAAVALSAPLAHLVLVGSGEGQPLSVEPELRERVARAALEGRVTFTGRVDDVEDYLRASDIFAFPSLFEGLGLSLLEAAACGLPCVGSRTGGIVDVIEDGRCGMLVEPGDTRGLAAALGTLLADPARRDAMGAEARAIAATRFDVRDSVDRYRALFAELSPLSRSAASSTGHAPRGGAAPPR